MRDLTYFTASCLRALDSLLRGPDIFPMSISFLVHSTILSDIVENGTFFKAMRANPVAIRLHEVSDSERTFECNGSSSDDDILIRIIVVISLLLCATSHCFRRLPIICKP